MLKIKVDTLGNFYQSPDEQPWLGLKLNLKATFYFSQENANMSFEKIHIYINSCVSSMFYVHYCLYITKGPPPFGYFGAALHKIKIRNE